MPLDSFRFSQIIIAGGDDDITPSDLIDWVHPVLAGSPPGEWFAAELALSGKDVLHMVCRCGREPAPTAALGGLSPEERLSLMHCLPQHDVAVIMLERHGPQVMALLDNVARWLTVFDRDDPALTPLLWLLERFCTARAANLRNEKGPVSGALVEAAAV